MRQIGLHIRVTDTIIHAVDYAQQLQVPIFQCFLINQSNRKPLLIDHTIAEDFKKKATNQRLYVHGSYWINLAHHKKNGLSILQKEIMQAKQLGSEHIILHPGAALDAPSHSHGITTLARILNKIMSYERTITFVLENTAHAHKTIGSNLQDFHQLKQKLDFPERIRFCLDTAHAHAYGYNIADITKQEEFIQHLEKTIGIDAIALIHLNDSVYQHSSHMDKHATLGNGTIGQTALKSFVLHPRLAAIPLILELPVLPKAQDNAMLQMVRQWHT